MVLAWMKPPLLFIILNGIILILAVSVKLFDQDAGVLFPPAPAMPAPVPASYLEEEVDILTEEADDDFQEVHVVVEDRSNSMIGRDDGSLEEVVGHNLGRVRPPVTVWPKGNLVKDNPPRFIQVKSVVGSVEGIDTRVLRTSKSHRYSSSSMDCMWRAICNNPNFSVNKIYTIYGISTK
ncbi:hypothetical protein MLD38_039863 [Melastoma candidum]|uniref:Uncharacterized protein n=1 Tax=Melastoma candidum TaxID=119954 RepID=A0ACB9L4V6_9MYRT|nr:hypothetical protein MLD38_039863 [Melastoma candidum]